MRRRRRCLAERLRGSCEHPAAPGRDVAATGRSSRFADPVVTGPTPDVYRRSSHGLPPSGHPRAMTTLRLIGSWWLVLACVAAYVTVVPLLGLMASAKAFGRTADGPSQHRSRALA